MKARFEHIDDYLAQAERLDSKTFASLRQQAASDLQQYGFPATKTEQWKYTSVKHLLADEFQAAGQASIATAMIEPYFLSNMDRIVVINGILSAEHTQLSKGIIAQSINTAPEKLGKLIDEKRPGFTALNSLLFEHGYYLQITKSLTQPLQILNIVTDCDADEFVQQRNLIEISENAEADIIEQFIATSADEYWRNSVTEVYLANSAKLSYHKLTQEAEQSSHVNYIAAQQAEKSELFLFNLDLTGKLIRNDVITRLQAENAHCEINGVYLARDKQHIDNHTSIEHLHSLTYSQEYYKGIIGDDAHAVFNGRVFVAQDAQKIDSAQQNKNLLLSSHAEIDTKPELEIYADDVKCAHGATVGQLDEKSVFYLQSRGIEAELAKKLLTYGFAHEVVETIESTAIRDVIQKALTDWFSADKQLEGLLQ